MKVTSFFIKQNQFLQDDEDLFVLDPSYHLSFDQFYQPIQTKKQELSIKKVKELQIEICLVIYLNDYLNVSIFQKIDDKLKRNEEIQTNPLSALLFQKICNKLKQNHSQHKQTEYNCFSDEIFASQSKKSPDILVRDIYGPDSSSINLPQKLLASSLGKLSKNSQQKFDSKEIIRSLLIALAINTGQIAGLLSRKHQINKIIIFNNKIGGMTFNRYLYVHFCDIKDNFKIQQPSILTFCQVQRQERQGLKFKAFPLMIYSFLLIGYKKKFKS